MYLTGSASSTNDMLNQLANFVSQSLTWSVVNNESITGGRWLVLQPPNSEVLIHYRYDDTEIYSSSLSPPNHLYMYGSTGFSSTENWDTQPGISTFVSRSFSNNWTSPINTFHFFLGDEYLHIVCLDGKGYWHHVSCMVFSPSRVAISQDTNNYYTTTTYEDTSTATSSRHARLYNAPTSSQTASLCQHFYRDGVWYSSTNNTASERRFFAVMYDWNTSSSAGGGLCNGLWRCTENVNTVTTPLIPPVCMWRTDEGDRFNVIGTIKNMRYVNIRYLDAGDSFFFGQDEWLIFPAIRKTNTSDEPALFLDIPNTWWMGYAYKK